MAADQERAERIRALKDERPDLRWKDIAEAVSVTERAAQEWARSGAMDYDKVEKLAGVFGVTADYIWRGTQANGNTPSPFADRDDVLDRLDRLEAAVAEIHALVRETNRAIMQQHSDGEDIQAALERLERAAAQELGDDQRPRRAAG
jgi:transcriptional regulator with XRE-family HTH domain